MKLRGILSSHGRRAVWEANNAPPAPAPQPVQPRPHHPEQQQDGTTRCCGRLYARRAFEDHMRGEPIGLTCDGIAMTAEDGAESHAAFERERKSPQPASEAAERERIRALVDAYLDSERRGKRVVRADGAEDAGYGF